MGDASRRRLLQFIGSVLLTLGLLQLVLSGVRYWRWHPLPSSDLAARTISVSSDGGPLLGCTYTISVDGQAYACPGGTKLPRSDKEAVVFDPVDPARCREEAARQGLGVYEWQVIGGAVVFVLVGGAMLAKLAAEAAARGRQRR